MVNLSRGNGMDYELGNNVGIRGVRESGGGRGLELSSPAGSIRTFKDPFMRKTTAQVGGVNLSRVTTDGYRSTDMGYTMPARKDTDWKTRFNVGVDSEGERRYGVSATKKF
jgi:hypothetical protein